MPLLFLSPVCVFFTFLPQYIYSALTVNSFFFFPSFSFGHTLLDVVKCQTTVWFTNLLLLKVLSKRLFLPRPYHTHRSVRRFSAVLQLTATLSIASATVKFSSLYSNCLSICKQQFPIVCNYIFFFTTFLSSTSPLVFSHQSFTFPPASPSSFPTSLHVLLPFTSPLRCPSLFSSIYLTFRLLPPL